MFVSVGSRMRVVPCFGFAFFAFYYWNDSCSSRLIVHSLFLRIAFANFAGLLSEPLFSTGALVVASLIVYFG